MSQRKSTAATKILSREPVPPILNQVWSLPARSPGALDQMLAALRAPLGRQGKDWDQLARGLLLVALDNRGGRLTKALGNSESEDEDFDPTPMFDRTDLWAVGLDDDDAIVLRGVGTCPDNDASEATVRAIRSLFDRALKELDQPGPQTRPRSADEAKADRMAQDFFKRTRAECEGRSVLVRAAGVGTLADFASLVAARVIN